MDPSRLQQRFRHQIEKLLEAFQLTHQDFEHSFPVDKSLTSFFRKHKQFGSKDRKLISNSIFGFYRWYGWLSPLLSDRKGLALLLGYLLDENFISDVILTWAAQWEIPEETLRSFALPENDSLERKLTLVKPFLGEITIEELNPKNIRNSWANDRIAYFQKRPPIWLRVNPSIQKIFALTLKQKDVDFQFHPQESTCLAIHSKVNLQEYSEFQEGLVEVQDISSQMVGLLCDPQSKDTWWDVCAGAGGKSLHLAALMKGKGRIISTEIRKSAYRELEKRVKRGRWGNIHPTLWSGEELPEESFHGVLVDAPCSCSGTWRRHPDLRWKFSKENIQSFSKLQGEILAKASDRVLSGGKLIYATCSFLEEENEQVIHQFLQKHPDFVLSEGEHPLTGEKFEKGVCIGPPEVDGIVVYVACMKRELK